jgi:quercetin dioxygenase-like cupin family protein
MTESPYLFRAAAHPLAQASPQLKLREAVTPFGLALRYQEREPGGAPPNWCLTGHSVFILEGRIAYEFDTHTVEAGPGDMLHIPAGPEHRHKPRAIGPHAVKYFLTEFV